MPLIYESTQLFQNSKEANLNGSKFLSDSRYVEGRFSNQRERIRFYNSAPAFQQEKLTHFKTYKYKTHIPLKRSKKAGGDLKFWEELVMRRQSVSSFSGMAISLDQLSGLLELSCGFNKKKMMGHEKICFRVSPSGGARYPLEVYIAALNVKGFSPGLYHYDVLNNQLDLLKDENPLDSLLAGTFRYATGIKNASLVIFITGIFDRTLIKYQERGWRLLFLEAGHLGQLIWLAATAQGLECTPSAGGMDSEINKFLDVNPNQEVFLMGYILSGEKIDQ